MSETLHHHGYDGSVHYDAEDRTYRGKVMGILDFVLYGGGDLETLEKNFQGAVEQYLQCSKEDGKQPEIPYAAMHLSFPTDLHWRASLFAEEHDLALSTVIEQALSQFLAHAD